MHPLFEKLLEKRIAITDGAWGTQLQARGLMPGACPDAWNLSHADRVADVARTYVEAGSDIVLTNTFGANRISLAAHGLEEDVEEINRRGVQISRQGADGRALVFASIGPSGKILATGDVSENELLDAFAAQAAALATAGADAIVIETMSDLTEAKLALRAARDTGLPVVACMVFDSGKALDRTMMGVSAEQAATELSAAGADAIGANCGQGIAGYVPICRRFREVTDLPIWIKANAGLPELVDAVAVYRTTPDEFASHAPDLVDAGASFVGGCCGTGPEFIRMLRGKLDGTGPR